MAASSWTALHLRETNNKADFAHPQLVDYVQFKLKCFDSLFLEGSFCKKQGIMKEGKHTQTRPHLRINIIFNGEMH